jgi:hypothetical protein
MPWKEPAPDFGIAEQAGPKVPSAAPPAWGEALGVDESDVEEESLEDEPDEELLESSEPQAAMPRDMASARAAMPVRAMVVLFMGVPLVGQRTLIGGLSVVAGGIRYRALGGLVPITRR